jgi:hypothetical protein
MVTVTCKVNGLPANNVSWTLSVPAGVNWLKLSRNPDGSDPQTTLTLTGTRKVYLVATYNHVEERKTDLSLAADGNPPVAAVHVIQTADGGAGDLLYFDGDVLRVSRWNSGHHINKENLAFFKFGSVVGFTGVNVKWSDALSNGELKFNVTGKDYTDYPQIPDYSKWNNADSKLEVSHNDYHNGENVKRGLGDPCRLVGLTAAQIRNMTEAQIDAHESGWRLPTIQEYLLFVRGTNEELGIYDNTVYGFWTDANNSPNPLTGTKLPGGWFPLNKASTVVNTEHGTLGPSAGSRLGHTGEISYINNFEGFFWSSTPEAEGANKTWWGYALRIKSNGPKQGETDVWVKISVLSGNGYPVRCVRK